ncbi:MAG: hypothetical protein A3I11_06670 [Elusimicrobia bacterium RIFCSPLOWO2_02_FULL_39_32]|nr:MAG: hypothetical protein A2034_03260 [Elusimicrobia bacterium GWA2_38_7]OGR81247.1 MAG: hypothetical protein A3B80_09280 [Elusimicrobia bacterium RIFCSPHIGHO2_02_FULL_39_36]OGR91799.1 MAG: hypothetical protein A3I11_06670 [Elusimicrobia bacterium RIFCSPLOWO2_02_FULL_39_32]OGR98458.1 MAG: hypothetical protein A3G85_02530 [Elusimicrobia bacterium RIFCSPLOWO2_12_FULL_39_28]
MPVISMFYGIIIRMFYFDTAKHKSPHIHVQYGEQHAVIHIPDGKILEGKVKSAKLKLIQAWIEIHREDIMADWKLAMEGQSVFKIEPLR